MSKMRALMLILGLGLLFGVALAADASKTMTPPTQTLTPLSKSKDGHKPPADDHEEDQKENKHEDRDERQHEQHGGGVEYDASYSFYGSVRWSGGAVVAGSRKLVGDNPWLEILAPGMRLEVQGEVEGSAIRVSRVEVRYPHSWSFYQGPAELVGLSGGWLRVWFEEDRGVKVFKKMVAGEEEGRLLLAACYHGGWKALPAALDPAVTPASSGWWLLEGSKTASGVIWRPVEKLPGDCH